MQSSNSEQNSMLETLFSGFRPKYLFAYISSNREGVGHRHDNFELVYHAEGSGMIEYPDQKVAFGKDSWSLTGPGILHKQINHGPYEDVCLLFSLDPCAAAPFHFDLRPSLELMGAAEEIRSLVKCGMAGSDRWRQMELNCRMGMILAAVLRTLQTPETLRQPGNPVWYADQAEKIILRNGFTDIKIQDIARQLNISADHLRHCYRQTRDRSLKTFFAEARLQYADKLLSYGGLTIKEIAEQCGYSSPSHFCSDYRKFHGQSPGGQNT